MSQNLQKIVEFQEFQLENLVDFEKCCKTHIFLQKSEPIQPKTSNIWMLLVWMLRARRGLARALRPDGGGAAGAGRGEQPQAERSCVR